uniref:Uncharacterized protein n=1 Tax=Triticum urartu TaxID=4572 RepID=A0A8R7VJ89_TRIUA
RRGRPQVPPAPGARAPRRLHLHPTPRRADGLLEVLQGCLVADEAHEPELEAVVGHQLDVLLLRPVLVLARYGRLHPPQRDVRLVRHPHRVALGRRQRQRPVAAEGHPLRRYEEHAGDRAGGGGQVAVALRGVEELFFLLHGEPPPEDVLHAAGLEDSRAQRQLAPHGLVQLRAESHCTIIKEDIYVQCL